MKRIALLAAVVAGALALACGGATPTAVDQTAPVAVTEDGGTVSASAGGKILFSGLLLGDCNDLPPRRELLTPGGVYHFFDGPVCTHLAGGVAGEVWFTESGSILKNDKGTFHGPFEGENVTWNGRSGKITGLWHTVCEGLSGLPTCGGTFEAQGSGGLQGVKFHFVWGPGWYPFDYKGFAIDNSR